MPGFVSVEKIYIIDRQCTVLYVIILRSKTHVLNTVSRGSNQKFILLSRTRAAAAASDAPHVYGISSPNVIILERKALIII